MRGETELEFDRLGVQTPSRVYSGSGAISPMKPVSLGLYPLR
jgi:hypothetical protein